MGTRRDGSSLREFSDGRVQPIPHDVVAARRVGLQHSAEEVGQIRDVDGQTVLFPCPA